MAVVVLAFFSVVASSTNLSTHTKWGCFALQSYAFFPVRLVKIICFFISVHMDERKKFPTIIFNKFSCLIALFIQIFLLNFVPFHLIEVS